MTKHQSPSGREQAPVSGAGAEPRPSTDLTFLTNEPGKTLLERFKKLLAADTRFFDCLVGYFFVSGFHQLFPSLEATEKIRILIGLKTDRTTYDLLQKAKGEQLELSHAEMKEQVPGAVLEELDRAEDTIDVETGVRQFVTWARSGKLEIRAYASGKIHAKVLNGAQRQFSKAWKGTLTLTPRNRSVTSTISCTGFTRSTRRNVG